MKKVGFIGCGNMGEAMLLGSIRGGFASGDQIIAFDAFGKEKLERLNKDHGVAIAESNLDIAKNARIIVLSVKPDVYHLVIDEIKDAVTEDTIVVTIAPSFTREVIQSMFGKDVKVARAMPNTPALVECGVTGVCFTDNISTDERKEVVELFSCFGEAIEVKEELIKAVCSVSGSGPAYIYVLIEAMADGAVLMGMSRKDAYIFAAKTVEGAAKMVLETGKHPGELKDAVCSPGGTSIAGVAELERNGFKGNIIKGMMKAGERFQEMEDMQGQ